MRIENMFFWVCSRLVEGFREYVNQILQKKSDVNIICYERFFQKGKKSIIN